VTGAAVRGLTALAALIVSLVVAEVALVLGGLPRERAEFQFVRPDLEVGEVFADLGAAVVPDPELFWTLDPSLGSRLANSHGLRGWWPSREKGPRDLRVVCIGDSCTYGTSVRYEDSYGVRLESMLQEAFPSRCVESILLAVPGYSTLQNRLLSERYLVELQPDVTVLYCGAWNDYLPAVSMTDAERHARSTSAAPRLLRLASSMLEPAPLPEAELKRAFSEGRAPRGRRVPLDEFRANLEAMVALAAAGGGQVVLVLPPLPAETEQRYPVSLDYRAAVRDVARGRGLPLVDAPARFAAAAEATELFEDWVHPTVAGHQLIASALMSLVAEQVPAVDGAPAAGSPTISGVSPQGMRELTTQRFELAGRGFASAAAFDRLWVGRHWIDDFQVEADDRISFTVTRPVAPGRHPISLRTRGGVVSAAAELSVERAPPELAASVRAVDGARELVVSGRAAADCLVGVWLSSGVLAQPFDSGYGPWQLEVDLTGQTPGAMRFDRLSLFSANAQTDPTGAWEVVIDLSQPGVPAAGDAMFAQAILVDRYDPTLGSFSSAVRVDLGR